MKQTSGRRSWGWLGAFFLLFAMGIGHTEETRGVSYSDFLAQAAREILDEAAGAVQPTEEASNGAAGLGEAEVGGALASPPEGAAPNGPGRQAQSVLAPVVRQSRETSKGVPEAAGTYASNSPAVPEARESWRQLGFAAGSYRPEPGLDPDLVAAAGVLSKEGRRQVYGFMLLKEYLTDATRSELEALGVKVLGPHGTSYKARFPADAASLGRVGALGSVEWLGFSKREQKLSPELKAAIAPASEAPDKLPVVINLFENVAGFKEKLESSGAVVGKYDRDLTAYRAVVDRNSLDAILGLDFVLYVELVRQTFAGHDQSAATIGVDYIRPGAPGTTFDGSPIPLGIMDTGFMLGGAAAVPHVDLNANGCGINFTTDVADVWNDQNGHGSHTLGTIIGRGVGNSRYRGVGIGIGSSVRVRAAKVWGSTGSGSTAWMESAMDFFDDALACDSARPLVVSISGGAGGTNLVGTDSLSRKLDEKVYGFGQMYVSCGGNSGPGAGTIWTPGVAKNAFAIGNALDNGYLTVGDISNSSSRGPAGDGRRKPNVVGPGTTVTSVFAGTANQYTNMNGCSMATPHVSGLAATLMQHYTEFQDRPALLRSVMMATALPHDNALFADNTYGFGRVDAYSPHWADFGANGWRTNWFWADSVGTGNWIFGDITVPAGTDKLIAVLTWDEPAASAGASAAVNNDVDLWVDFNNDCGGGNCGEYVSATVVDNVEYVVVNNPPAGVYRMKAYNFNVSQTVHLGMSANIIVGDPTPATTLSGFSSTPTPVIGNDFTITTTVFDPAYIASGVHLENTVLPPGVIRVDLQTTREDGIGMSFGTATNLTLGNIRAGDSRSAVWTFRLTTPGTKAFTFRSWSENGGELTTNVTVTDAKPDLLITALSAPASAQPGDVISVSNTVQNSGTAPAGAFRVGLYLSTDNVCTTGDTLIGSRGLAGLGVGLSSAANTNVTIPPGASLGARFICAIADDLLAVTESNEGNNTASTSITIVQPDLRISAISGPASVSPGGGFNLSNTVINSGTGSAGAFRVGLYLSSDNNCTTGDTFLASRNLAGLGVGLSSAANTPVTIPAATSLGPYFLCAIADDLVAVAESNEGNNTNSTPLSVLSATPILTLKVNGLHPTPPVVTTTGPYLLTLDMSATTYTASLGWYWALVYNGQVFWVTSGGLSNVPSPLLNSPPIAFTNLTLLNLNLPVGTNITNAFFLLNGGTLVSSDIISTTVVP